MHVPSHRTWKGHLEDISFYFFNAITELFYLMPGTVLNAQQVHDPLKPSNSLMNLVLV